MIALGWWAGWLLLIVLRLCLLAGWMWRGDLFGAAVFAAELGAVTLGIVNAFVARHRDERLVGLAVPLAYCVGVFLVPRVSLSAAGITLLVAGLALSTWALLCLRSRFSVAGSAWVGLCDWGPYRWVRHPQLLARLMMVAAVAISAPRLWQLALCVVAGSITLAVVQVEEGMLREFPEWVAYSRRVRWQLLPGVR